MSLERIGAVVGIIGGTLGIILGLFALTERWDEIERFAQWLYPLPLVILLGLALLGVTALYVRQRVRTTPKTMRELSNEQREERERLKAEARRTVTPIANEVASNRRIARKALGRGELSRKLVTENWETHRHALAELRDAEKVYEVTSKAYDAFADLRPLSR